MKTYEAILRDDRIEWLGEKPKTNGVGLNVRITVPEEAPEVSADTPFRPNYVNSIAEAEAQPWTEEKRAEIREILAKIAESGAFREIPDPVAWQREIRKDRPLLGREP